MEFKREIGGKLLLLLNVLLLVSLLGLAFLHITRTEQSGEFLLHEQTEAVKKEMKTLIGFSSRNDITSLRPYMSYVNRPDGNLRKSALHLQKAQYIDTTDRVPALLWQYDVNSTHNEINSQDKDLRYKDGYIAVKDAGYYYIYTTITYRGSGTMELDYGRIIHNVLVSEDGALDSTILMRNLQSTPTLRRGRLAFTSSSLGATFFLPSGSKVKVTASNPSHIDPSPHASSFGLFLI